MPFFEGAGDFGTGAAAGKHVVDENVGAFGIDVLDAERFKIHGGTIVGEAVFITVD